MPGLLLGITLAYWGLGLLNVLTLNNTLLGLLALITGILFIVGGWVALPPLPTRRQPPQA